MGIRFPERDEKMPDDVCQAINYIYNALYGRNKRVDFDLNQLCLLFEFLGSINTTFTKGSVIQFDFKDCPPMTIHYKTKRKGTLSCPLKYLQGNSEFCNSFQIRQEQGLRFREFIEFLNEFCTRG